MTLVVNIFIFIFRMRSDQCEELKKIESKILVLQGHLEEFEHRNNELDERKRYNLSR